MPNKYYLILELPLNVTLVWEEPFGTWSEAEDVIARLPEGFVIQETCPPDAIKVPMTKKVRVHGIQ